MTDLKDIIFISGKPGLYKIISRSVKNIIVESIDKEKKRFPLHANLQVSSLEDITIYNNSSEELQLKNVFENIEKKDGEGSAVLPDSPPDVLRNYFKEVAPDYDEERVYTSDIKKVLKWYFILKEQNN